jgi:hypothetical protein
LLYAFAHSNSKELLSNISYKERWKKCGHPLKWSGLVQEENKREKKENNKYKTTKFKELQMYNIEGDIIVNLKTVALLLALFSPIINNCLILCQAGHEQSKGFDFTRSSILNLKSWVEIHQF